MKTFERYLALLITFVSFYVAIHSVAPDLPFWPKGYAFMVWMYIGVGSFYDWREK